nr:MAG TPA: hypothetical protein [Caudoviricetes sp.]
MPISTISANIFFRNTLVSFRYILELPPAFGRGVLFRHLI